LSQALTKQGHEVVYGLFQGLPPAPPIDVAFVFDPRFNHLSEKMAHIIEYKRNHNKDLKIIQRVGDLGTHGKPDLFKLVERFFDFSDIKVFPSNWAREYAKCERDDYKIIYNRPLPAFHSYKRDVPLGDKIELITHHWSTNPKKGFEIYRYLDENIVGDEIDFTYIGRTPEGFTFKNSTHLSPTSNNEQLAKRLSQADIYFTASEEEAGANHVLEGMAAGLPVLYYAKGGSVVEYCREYGVEFSSPDEILRKIAKVATNYSEYKEKVLEYDATIDVVVEEYLKIINKCKIEYKILSTTP